MCAIFCSFDVNMLNKLYKLNAYRGELGYSLGIFKTEYTTTLQNLFQEKEPYPEDFISKIGAPGHYYVGHSQAPTTNNDNQHPSVVKTSYLWHNGIIKQSRIPEGYWDTLWLHEKIVYKGFESLSDIDGTFACVYYNNYELLVFRNEISPLYYDNNLNISSTEFEGSALLPANKVFRLNTFNYKELPLSEVYSFETKENPYFIPE